MTGDAREEVPRLLAENRRLRELLTEHGIAWPPREITSTTDRSPRLGTILFRGREEVYPVRWESKAGKSGYSPACANERRAGICEKPRITCGDCAHRALIPVTGQTVFDHLAGRHTAGLYPLLTDDTCHFLAVDFPGGGLRRCRVARGRTHPRRLGTALTSHTCAPPAS